MSKIYIIGIVASGKTTLSKQLSKKLNIPFYELDIIVWHKTEGERYKRTPEQQVEVINEIDNNGDWIIEGTYRKSCHCLFDMADKIIFLDIPLWKRKYRILLRFIKQQLHIEKSNYKSDLNMLRFMYKWTYDFEKSRVDFNKMLNEYKDKLIIVKNHKELALTDLIGIPCHRMIGTGGKLVDYTGSLNIKGNLLKLEKTHGNS
jgi:adenylate kinase family enzyme